MAVNFTLYPDHGFAHIRFGGFVTPAETLARAAEFAATPGVSPAWHQIIDFTEVTGWERDQFKLMAMLAGLTDHLIHAGHAPLFVYVAPHGIGQEMASFVMRAMEGLPGPHLRLTRTLHDALTLLGLPTTTIGAQG